MRENGDSEQVLITSLTLARFQLKSNHRPFSYTVLTPILQESKGFWVNYTNVLIPESRAKYMLPSTLQLKTLRLELPGYGGTSL